VGSGLWAGYSGQCTSWRVWQETVFNPTGGSTLFCDQQQNPKSLVLYSMQCSVVCWVNALWAYTKGDNSLVPQLPVVTYITHRSICDQDQESLSMEIVLDFFSRLLISGF